MQLRAFKFLLVSSGFKRAQVCETLINLKIYPPPPIPQPVQFKRNMMKDKYFVRSWRSRGCSEKGFEGEETKHPAAEDWASCYSWAAHLRTDGGERGGRCVRRSRGSSMVRSG